MSERRPSDKRVPSVPPIDGIADPQVRAVLEALVQGWQVRNGQAATTDEHRFITKADVRGWMNDGTIMPGMKGSGGLGGGPSVPGGTPTTNTQQQVTALVDAVTNAVKQSEFFQFLGRRIDKIEPPLAKLGADAERMTTLIQAETNARHNADNAVVTSLNQVFAGLAATIRPVWAMRTDGFNIQVNNAAAFVQDYKQIATTVGAHTNLIQQETINRTTADGKLFGQWSLKIDQDGYVSGFGLSSSTTPTSRLSEFYVRADVFAIGSPGVPRPILRYEPDGAGGQKPVYGDPPEANVPFVVRTTAQPDSSVPGGVIPPGVYMKDAFIQYGAIGRAQIGLAEVDALSIRGNAVMIPYFAQATGVAISTTPTNVATLAVQFPNTNFRLGSVEGYAGLPLRPSAVIVVGSFFMANNTSGHALSSVHFDLVKDGSWAMSGGAFTVDDGRSYQCTLVAVDPNPGVFTSYALKVWTGGGFSADANSITIFAMGAQR